MMEKGSTNKITQFTDLLAWKTSHVLVLGIYRSTSKFPKSEIFSLTSQMRRAAVSIPSNISEGFARRTYKEKSQFYYIAQGSLIELRAQLLISRDLGYLGNEEFSILDSQAVTAHKLLQGLIMFVNSRK